MDEPLEVEPGKTVRGRIEPAVKVDLPAGLVRINTAGRDFTASAHHTKAILEAMEWPEVTLAGLRRALAVHAATHPLSINQVALLDKLIDDCLKEAGHG